VSELPSLEAALLEAAHRRYGRPWWRSGVARAERRAAPVVAIGATLTLAVMAVAVLTLPGSDGADERTVTRSGDGWTTIVNDARGFEVSLPPGWRLASESLTRTSPSLGNFSRRRRSPWGTARAHATTCPRAR
jgi:hypothetical protein